MLMPAPSAVARPTSSAACELDSKATAKIGASVDSVPSMSPTRPGCTYCSTKACSSASMWCKRVLAKPASCWTTELV
jgi:hypothetical protein